MRENSANRSRRAQGRRRALTTLGITGFAAALALFAMPGTAAATTTASECTGTVSGPMGDTLRLKSDSVRGYVVQSVHDGPEAPLLGIKNEQTRMREAFDAGEFEPIALPAIPRAASATLSGSDIATAVLKKLDSVSSVEDIMADETNRKNIRERVADNCGLTVKAGDYVAPTTSKPTTTASPAPSYDKPSSGTTPQTTVPSSAVAGTKSPATKYGTGTARVKPRDYNAVPFAMPGLPHSDADTYRSPSLPENFGVLGSDSAEDGGVQNAGNADAIGSSSPGEVSLPLLLAVVALAGAAAALVRTWVLRRTSEAL